MRLPPRSTAFRLAATGLLAANFVRSILLGDTGGAIGSAVGILLCTADPLALTKANAPGAPVACTIPLTAAIGATGTLTAQVHRADGGGGIAPAAGHGGSGPAGSGAHAVLAVTCSASGTGAAGSGGVGHLTVLRVNMGAAAA